MDADQEICLCFHVTRRKIENFIRLDQPVRAGQLAECFGAGTGCGWCRKYLVSLFESAQLAADSDKPSSPEIPSADSYAEMRRQYRAEKRQGAGPDSKT
ncbi:MAG: (2Fe-2S)-binding protein [Pirellulaceae bacterium]|nr:(2Fe-2S)-binding protein [Pirellulaceae bacterium]